MSHDHINKRYSDKDWFAETNKLLFLTLYTKLSMSIEFANKAFDIKIALNHSPYFGLSLAQFSIGARSLSLPPPSPLRRK